VGNGVMGELSWSCTMQVTIHMLIISDPLEGWRNSSNSV
jgi:hypothetical protein